MKIIYKNVATNYVDKARRNSNPLSTVRSRNIKFQESTPLHRIIPISRIEELLNGRFTMVNPSFWEKNDPLENFLFDIEFKSIELNDKPFNDKDDFYGTCWSTVKNSYALWTIYSGEERGIMISTTTEKINNCFDEEDDLFIGPVEYLSEEELKILLQHEANNIAHKICEPGPHIGKIEALMIKRKAFLYEQEVRMVKYTKNIDQKGRYTINGFNPHELISKLTLDPRMSEVECESFINVLKNYDFFNTGGKGGQRKVERCRLLHKKKIII